MLTNKPALQMLVLSILPASFFLVSSAHAQQLRVEIPEMRIPELPGAGMGAIMDLQSFASGGSGRSVSMTIENGIRKIHGREDGIKAYIEEGPDQGILVKITRQYGADQMDVLMEEHPDLYMSMKDFPQESEGAEVEVTLGITRSYEAANKDELMEKHPKAYEVYERFTTSGSNRVFGSRFGDFPGLDFRVPEIRVIPREAGGGWRIDPNDVRIHEDEPRDRPGKKEEKASGDKDT